MGNQVSYDDDSILVEPWGGSGGSEWSYKLKSPIKEIMIVHGMVIDSIMFRTASEPTVDSPKFGGSGGGRRDKVTIEVTSMEFLIGISGNIGNYGGHLVVKSLCFITNIQTYGPFGSEAGGTPFSLVMKGGAIVGFHGRAGLYLDAIGVYVQKLTPPTSSKEPEGEKTEPNESIVEEIEIHDKMDVMKTIMPRSPGPWGGCSGKGWDDGVFSTIKQVHVHMNPFISAIHGLQVEYEKKDKTPFWSQLHGTGLGDGADTVRKINIDGENEFLIGMEGFYSPMKEAEGLDTIRQIAFYTNKGKYGPYGSKIGTYFSSPASKGRLVGFHGRSGLFLNAIGVHMEYF